MQQSNPNQKFTIQLGQQQAYRIQNAFYQIEITLLDGTAEIFGKELLINVPYNSQENESFQIYTWTGAKFQIGYLNNNHTHEEPGYLFQEEEYPQGKMMYQIAKINYVLDSYNIQFNIMIDIRKQGIQELKWVGPRVLVIGSKCSGKSTLSKTLLNYGYLGGWRPILVDLDSDQQSNFSTGTISASVFNNQPSESTKKISYFFGHILGEMRRDNFYQKLYSSLVQQMGKMVIQKLQADLKIQQKDREQLLLKFQRQFNQSTDLQGQFQFIQQENQNNLKAQDLIKLFYQQSILQQESKSISASGSIINCPTFQGYPQENHALLEQIIREFQVTMIIVIDLPDTFRELENYLATPQMKEFNTKISLIKMEKLRGVAQQHNIELRAQQQVKNYFSRFLVSESIPQDKICLYQQSKNNTEINFERVDKNLVYLVIAVLHLKVTSIDSVIKNAQISDEEKNKKINNLILRSPISFLSYVDCFVSSEQAFMLLIPDESYVKTLKENVWVTGTLNFVRMK